MAAELTTDEIDLLVSLACRLDWAPLCTVPPRMSTRNGYHDFAALLSKLQTWATAGRPMALELPLGDAVPVPVATWRAALQVLAKHRDNCHMYKPEHEAVSLVVRDLKQAGGNRHA